jgi:hypothetical protein
VAYVQCEEEDRKDDAMAASPGEGLLVLLSRRDDAIVVLRVLQLPPLLEKRLGFPRQGSINNGAPGSLAACGRCNSDDMRRLPPPR